jgi:hypothetical protein
MAASHGDRNVQAAAKLLQLGISHAGVIELLQFPIDQVEQQLEWLPFRKAKRPGAFLINAVRNNYSPPKEAYYAKDQIKAHGFDDSLDQNT